MKELAQKLGFSKKIDASIEITLDGEETKKNISIPIIDENGDKVTKRIPLYTGDELVSGKLIVRSRAGRIEHSGIRIRLIGIIEVINGEQPDSEFMTNSLDLEPAGSFTDMKSYPFHFPSFQKPYDSFYGSSFRIKYIIRAGIYKNRSDIDVYSELDIGVIDMTQKEKPNSNPISMEVGIESLISINIQLPKNIYNIKQCIEGSIKFLLVKLMLQKMDILIMRKEIIGSGEKALIHSEEISSFELMDGCPVNGKLIRRRNSIKVLFRICSWLGSDYR